VLHFHPFAAYRPIPTKSAEISCEPGGRLLLQEAVRRIEAFPNSWLQVIRDDVREHLHDPDAGERLFDRLTGEHWMLRDPQPHLYVYRQVRSTRKMVSLVAALEMSAAAQASILRVQARDEEQVRRTRQRDARLGVQAEVPLFAYQDHEELTCAIRGETNERPLAHYLGKDGATHTVWSCREPGPLIQLAGQLRSLVALSGDELFVDDADGEAPRRAVALTSIDQVTIRASHIAVFGGDAASLARRLNEFQNAGAIEIPENPGEPPSGFFDAYLGGPGHSSDGSGFWMRVRIPSAKPGQSAAANWDRTRFEQGVLSHWLTHGHHALPPRVRSFSAAIAPSHLTPLVHSGEASALFVFAAPSMGEILEIAQGHECVPHDAITLDQAVPSGLFVQPTA
jgi:hypothetical protein